MFDLGLSIESEYEKLLACTVTRVAFTGGSGGSCLSRSQRRCGSSASEAGAGQEHGENTADLVSGMAATKWERRLR